MSTVEKEEKSITRREFVKGAAVGAAGVAAAGVLASCTTPTPEVIEVTKEVIKEVPVTREVIKEVIKEVPAGAGPVTFELFNPSGASEITKLFANRLDTLEGKTICLIGATWGGDMSLPVTEELLTKMYPTAKIIPYTEMPDVGDLAGIQKAITEKGCDAVIQGNAG